jgi:hypothetical protein
MKSKPNKALGKNTMFVPEKAGITECDLDSRAN